MPISSSIVGAIALIISLFFYMYLNHVFKIQFPTPPHVGFSDTDASSIWSKLSKKNSESIEEANEKDVDKPI